ARSTPTPQRSRSPETRCSSLGVRRRLRDPSDLGPHLARSTPTPQRSRSPETRCSSLGVRRRLRDPSDLGPHLSHSTPTAPIALPPKKRRRSWSPPASWRSPLARDDDSEGTSEIRDRADFVDNAVRVVGPGTVSPATTCRALRRSCARRRLHRATSCKL